MAVLAFNRRKFDLQSLHRDIDRLTALAATVATSDWRPDSAKLVENAKAIFTQFQTRCEALELSADEESVLYVKMDRLKTRLATLDRRTKDTARPFLRGGINL